MKNILNIVKKELDKIFHSPRLILSTFILPGLMIFAIYTLIGQNASKQIDQNFEHEYKIGITGYESNTLKTYLENMMYDENHKYNVKVSYEDNFENTTFEEYSSQTIKDEVYDLWIVVSDNFDQIISKEETGIAQVQLFTHASNTFSAYIYQIVYSNLSILHTALNGPGDYVISQEVKELSSAEEQGATMLGMMAPMLIITFIFAGALSIGADSIAGEKERGTIATILMAPISKNDIVLGKIISTIIITIISALCSFTGLIASLSQLMKAVGEGASISFSLTFGSGLQLFVLILLVSLIAVSLFMVASTFAKTTKEATMYAMPVYIIGIIMGTLTMFENSLPTNIGPYLIPIYNLVIGFKGCFMNQLDPIKFLIIVCSNIVYFSIILFIVRKMFDSEKIMFAR